MKYLLISCLSLLLSAQTLSALEREIKTDRFTDIVSHAKDPSAVWGEEIDDPQCKSSLLIRVDNAIIMTDFKEKIPAKGYGFSTDNKPIRQSFLYKNADSVEWIHSDTCTAARSENGVGFVFEYDQNIPLLKGKQFKLLITHIVENSEGLIEGGYALTSK